jgi:DNA ligase 1
MSDPGGDDAIARATGVSGVLTRRALMLSGDLARTAEMAITNGEGALRAVGFEIFRPILPMLASSAASVSYIMVGKCFKG